MNIFIYVYFHVIKSYCKIFVSICKIETTWLSFLYVGSCPGPAGEVRGMLGRVTTQVTLYRPLIGGKLTIRASDWPREYLKLQQQDLASTTTTTTSQTTT